jgi:hypothetical protein
LVYPEAIQKVFGFYPEKLKCAIQKEKGPREQRFCRNFVVSRKLSRVFAYPEFFWIGSLDRNLLMAFWIEISG